MSIQLAPLSASVTRILSLTGFSKELKTRDIQAAFSDWENVLGGFKIKWLDDTSLLIVFADAGVAKRAYLQTLASPPLPIFSPTGSSGNVAVIRPYDGPDAQAIIQNINARHNSTGTGRGHGSRASVSVPNASGIGYARANSNGGSRYGSVSSNMLEHVGGGPQLMIPNGAQQQSPTVGRDASPTLPNIPSHPTLESLMSSAAAFEEQSLLDDFGNATISGDETQGGLGPRIGDPGKRMLGAALGLRLPSMGRGNISVGESEFDHNGAHQGSEALPAWA